MEEFIKSTKNFIINNRCVIITVIFFCILSYGYTITNFTVGVDSEYAIVEGESNSINWISQGRFTIGALKELLMTNNIIPFKNTFLCVVVMAITSIYTCSVLSNIIGKNNTIANIVFCIIFLTLPISVHYIYFTTFNVEISIGMLFTTIVAKLSYDYINNKFNAKNKNSEYIYLGLCVFILACCIGIYQSFISYYITLICTFMLLKIINDDNIRNIKDIVRLCKNIIYYIMIIIMSIIAYYIMNKILLKLFSISSDSYIDGFIGWTRRPLKETIVLIKDFIISIFFKNAVYGANIIMPTVMLTLILGIWYVFKCKKYSKFIIPVIFMVILFSPFIISILLGTTMPYRTMQTLTIMISCIWYIFAISINKKNFSYALVFATIVIGIRQSTYIIKLNYSDNIRYQQDLNFSNKLANDIYDIVDGKINNYKLCIYGKKEAGQVTAIINQELIGKSIYEWDNGNMFRMRSFINVAGYDFKLATTEDKEKYQEVAKDLSIYPSEGSIRVYDDIVVVKISDFSI